MDFAIVTNAGQPDMTFEKCQDISNNIFLSLEIAKGSFFVDPEFGLRRRERLKNTEQSARLVRQDCLDALQWIIATGRAKTIEVFTERDRSENLNRLKVLVVAVQADGRKVTYEKFTEVV